MTQPTLWDAPVTPKPENPVATEKTRLRAAARRILAYLEKHGFATNVTLSHPTIGGLRFGGRLKELRDDGWLIETSHLKGGRFGYRFKGRKPA